MTITKFSSAAPPAFVRTDIFFAGPPVVIGYWVNLQGNDIKLADGDYIVQDDNGNIIAYTSAAVYAADANSQQIIKEGVGKQLLRAIWQTLSQSGLSDTVKASILNTISVTLIAILAGEIRAAQVIANATATDANFTASRKTTLLNLIAIAITQL